MSHHSARLFCSFCILGLPHAHGRPPGSMAARRRERSMTCEVALSQERIGHHLTPDRFFCIFLTGMGKREAACAPISRQGGTKPECSDHVLVRRPPSPKSTRA